MGGGSWSSSSYDDAKRVRAATGTPDFAYDAAVKSGAATDIHPDLDPKKVAGPASPLAGQPIRESRDSDEHPESLPISMFFDVTGSMGGIPKTLQKKLSKLMDVIKDKGGVKHPQILVGAVGDAHCDRYPFQAGQFESDNRFDEQLRNIILEGGGGGQHMESYALAWRFAADHTATDAYEKRGKKGFFFTMGDEAPWPQVTRGEVETVFGIKSEADEDISDLLTRAQEKWEIFHLHSQDGTYRDAPQVLEPWQKLLGERLVKVEDSSLVCEIIAGIVHMIEGAHDADKVVKDIGLKGKAAKTVSTALATIASNLPTHVATATGALAPVKKKRSVSRV